MRNSRDDPTIGVSCGHRVPRTPRWVALKNGKRGFRYWCKTCGEYRMSGGKTNGLRAFDFLLELRDEISTRDIVVVDPCTEHGRAVVLALGATLKPRWIAADRIVAGRS